MNDERFSELIAPIVDLRSSGAATDADLFKELSGTLCYPATDFIDLPYHEKRYLLAYAAARSSPSYARALLIEAGIENISTQFQIGRFRPDLCIGGWLLVEVDGRGKYEGASGQRLAYKDLMRQREIENQGYVFRRVTPEYLLKHPDRFVADIVEVMAARRRGPLHSPHL